MIDKVMRGSVRMLAEQGWDGVKFDSCSQFHNLTRWAECVAWDAKEKLATTAVARTEQTAVARTSRATDELQTTATV